MSNVSPYQNDKIGISDIFWEKLFNMFNIKLVKIILFFFTIKFGTIFTDSRKYNLKLCKTALLRKYVFDAVFVLIFKI